MEELKPCAYCGGELEVRHTSWRDSYIVWHKDTDDAKANNCPMYVACYATSEDAIRAVNDRHVETCENIGKYHEVDQFICSECGIWLEDWVEVESDEDNEGYEYALRYCPNCGRKIV